METRIIRTYHGQSVTVMVGQFLVNEYYKGFLNRVYPMETRAGAEKMKALLDEQESYMMQRNKHFRIQEVK